MSETIRGMMKIVIQRVLAGTRALLTSIASASPRIRETTTTRAEKRMVNHIESTKMSVRGSLVRLSRPTKRSRSSVRARRIVTTSG